MLTPMSCFPIQAVLAPSGITSFGPQIPHSIRLELSIARYLNEHHLKPAPWVTPVLHQAHFLQWMFFILLHNLTLVKRKAASTSIASSVHSPLHLRRILRHPVSRFLSCSFSISFYHKYSVLTVTIWDFHLFFQTGTLCPAHKSPLIPNMGVFEPWLHVPYWGQVLFQATCPFGKLFVFFLFESYRSIDIQEVILRR